MSDFSLSQSITAIEQNAIFSRWKEQHPDSFLTSLVILLQDTVESVQANYIIPGKKEIYSFSKDATEPSVSPPLQEKIMSPLLLDNYLPLTDALQQAHQEKEQQNRTDQIKKTLAILQCEEETFWNITFVTGSLKTINVHVNNDGKIKHYDCSTLIDFA